MLGVSPGRIGSVGAISLRRLIPVDVPAEMLRREADGTVTVLDLPTPWTPTLTRQGDGTVVVS